MHYIIQNEKNTFEDHDIKCCVCGTIIENNPTKMCISCVKSNINITSDIARSYAIHQCRLCLRFLQPPMTWIKADMHSSDLLSICLKKIRRLNKFKLINAVFSWTEPHSKRLIVNITVQKEVTKKAILEEEISIKYIIAAQTCNDCHRIEAKDYWRAVVQLRQKTLFRKTILYMEQKIVKSCAHKDCTKIDMLSDGIDFYFAQLQDAKKLNDYIMCNTPSKYHTSKELVTHNEHTSVYTYKNTFSIEISPICNEHVVCLPKKLAVKLGNLSQICVCIKIAQDIHLIDPTTARITNITKELYWKCPFKPLFDLKKMVKFIVLDINKIEKAQLPHVSGASRISKKHSLAEAWVTLQDRIGQDEIIYTKTHLGNILKVGDLVMGYHLENAMCNNSDFDQMNCDVIPSVVLIKKKYDPENGTIRERKYKRMEQINPTNTEDVIDYAANLMEYSSDYEESGIANSSFFNFLYFDTPLSKKLQWFIKWALSPRVVRKAY
ncbi:60S ribosomal export protein NMD3 [Intoshia linei]|uniref:60S ribosomal export protein NMD3 n=1 Tax=Intoshia linei TaxID=1819745 RepID=A0A177AZ56_9BILA|nr:60S ribosomal export protein NMD3 [Intoshia linei]